MLVIRDAKLETVCGLTSTLPENSLPEVAFAGKSNVGKSSLINALMNRKSLARTSSEPGKTRTINFYRIDAFDRQQGEEGEIRKDASMYLVDLPGYGYAKVSKTEAASWGGMIEGYLNTSSRLRAIFLLVDIRHEPSAADRQMCEYITAAGFVPVIIATKSDKLKRSQISKQLSVIRKSLSLPENARLFPFSALSRDGLEKISSYMVECTDGRE